MASLMDSHQLRIPFADIELATKKFSTLIGKGGYGQVYKGELFLSGTLTTVAVKRLDSNISGQGFKEFLTEIQLLSSYEHPNLISLLGFCEEGDEKILVYKYAEHGSLDKYLNMAETTCTLTWKQRIQICLDAARGIDFLHNGVAQQHRVIHRDIKSANVLLDGNLKAMIADLGLSKIGPANEKDTFLITNACGTHGYCDPVYETTGILTKESDIFSFGVVLFEVLCGRLCFMNVDNVHRFLVPLAQSHYENERLAEIIDPDLRKQMNKNSLNTFSTIAYQCLQMERKKRPSADLVVKKLLEAIEFQEIHEGKPNSMNYEQINLMSDFPVAYDTKEELYSHLSKGILLDGGKVWLLVNNEGNHVLISLNASTYTHQKVNKWFPRLESRFPEVAKILDPSNINIKVQITTPFLSRGVTYAACLVLLDGFSKEYYSSGASVLIEGIEFQPMNKIEDEDNEKSNDENNGGDLRRSKTNQENQLPEDYDEIVKMLKKVVGNITEEDLNSFLSKGMLVMEGVWFWLNNSDGKKCYMLGAKRLLDYEDGPTGLSNQYRGGRHGGHGARHRGRGDGPGDIRPGIQLNYKNKVQSETRFGSVEKFLSLSYENNYLKMRGSIEQNFLSPKVAYACYLVYKLPKGCTGFKHPVQVKIFSGDVRSTTYVHLIRPQSPMIGAKNERICYNPIKRPKIKGLAIKREDGWWEVSLFDFIYDKKDGNAFFLSTNQSSTKRYDSNMHIEMRSEGGDISYLTIYGLEFRPI